MLNAELKSIDVKGTWLRDYMPENTTSHAVWITASVGVADSSAADSFQVLVCSTSWLDVQLRHVGEDGLAFDQVSWLGHQCVPTEFRSDQFWSQLKWVATAMELEGEDLVRLELPE